MNKVERFISPEFANVLYNHTLNEAGYTDDFVSIGSKIRSDDSIMTLLLSELKPRVEELYGKRLHETCSFYRVYSQGQDLRKHLDRPACEVSVTLFLGCNFDWQWPIFVDGKPYGMGQGEGLIYKGCEQLHWREPLVYVPHLNATNHQEPVNLIHSQVYLHYSEAGGQFDPEHKWDAAHAAELGHEIPQKTST